ncbi:MAG: UDP-glucose 4-epimerase GalE [Deltaproteobacteria bacterium]|jgi:UDP-glucose 4-epimerase|nr:UDP-glucose 4-epimerase GalE [Deltaproteobacteria bacterium]
MAILVCGGAGYIGSHAVRALLEGGEEVVIVDNLLTGFAEAVPPGAEFYAVDVRDSEKLGAIFQKHDIGEVMHFAASSQVGESVVKPLFYFNNNVYGMQSLLETMVRHGVGSIVFSSSAAVYGEPLVTPIDEKAPIAPKSPYGESKAIMEKMMRWVGAAHKIRFASLRYFNVAGAIEGGAIGEAHAPETHLIPIVLQVPLGQRRNVTVFGDDYDTPDGTCVRDYIHVCDLVDAHLLALDYLRRGGESDRFNLGSEKGFSVMEIIRAAESVVGRIIPFSIGPRRAGDPDKLVASSEKAKKILGWTPRLTAAEEIIQSAWKWHSARPLGYKHNDQNKLKDQNRNEH